MQKEKHARIVKQGHFDGAWNEDRAPFGMYRKGVVGDWKNYFTVAMNEWFDEIIAEKTKAWWLDMKFE